MKKLLLLCWALACVLCCAGQAEAVQAEDISGKTLVAEEKGLGSVTQIFDGRTIESAKIRDGGHITLRHEAGIGSLYLVFGAEYGPYTVRDDTTGQTATFGTNDFLHEFLDLEGAFGAPPTQVTLSFDNGDCQLNELSAFTSGEIPDWVQRWQPPAEGKTDLALFSTHGDDEQLYFAGMLPYYAGELGYEVQVIYLTGHRNMTMRRSHEMLDGLWAVGVRHYPVFGPYGDYHTTSLTAAYQKYGYKGIDREELLSFVVENLRRFRPKVAVGHDLEGEYGHGMHRLYADLLCGAVEASGDGARFPESAEKYGAWDVPKTYLHLYPENAIRMNWDIPLERFDGMTAYEVTKERGFPCHVSQQSYYKSYFEGFDTAVSIRENSPCEFGLYRSLVGADEAGGDFFENLTTHAQDAALEAQRQAEEAARRKEEDACRREEEQQRVEAAAQKARTLHTQRQAAEPVSSRKPAFEWSYLAIPAGILAVFLLWRAWKKYE